MALAHFPIILGMALTVFTFTLAAGQEYLIGDAQKKHSSDHASNCPHEPLVGDQPEDSGTLVGGMIDSNPL